MACAADRQSDAPTITPQAVVVLAPDESPVEVTGLGSTSETLTRGEDLYVGVARFTITSPGDYRVQVTSRSPTTVVIGPSFGSGLGTVTGWLIAGGISAVAPLVALLLIVLSFLGRSAQPARAVPPTPAGWYPDPHGSGRLRYFDGEAWTGHLHP